MNTATRLYNYLRGLQDIFYEAPEFEELQQEVDQLYNDLSSKLEQENRHKLLKLVDNSTEISEERSLAAFAAGMRLAFGIMAELHLEPFYSFDDAEENRARTSNGK